MYTTINFKTKKALKEAVKNGDRITVYQPHDSVGVTIALVSKSWNTPQTISLEGPHTPQPHRWYATAILENGVVTKVS